MEALNNTELAGLFAIIMGSYKLIEMLVKALVSKSNNKKKNGADPNRSALNRNEYTLLHHIHEVLTEPTKSILSDQEKEFLKSLYDWHNISDESGVKRWIFPADFKPQQTKILESLTTISEKITLIYEKQDRIKEHVKDIKAAINK